MKYEKVNYPQYYIILRDWYDNRGKTQGFPHPIATTDNFEIAKHICKIEKEKNPNAEYSIPAPKPHYKLKE